MFAQPPWPGAATWKGEACVGNNASSWTGVSCNAGRVVGVDLQSLGASGSLDSFGRLNVLNNLFLSHNNFSGDPGYQAHLL